jgi:magnesium chelatase family protein
MPETLAKLFSAELEGITAKCIEVEVDLNVGLHAFNIVGLADKALSESRERVNSALKNSGAKPPNRENRKITVNLAPADIKKTGAQYDLAIALGYLLASGQIRKFDGRKIMFVGELALDGGVRGINGALNIAEMAAEHGFDSLMVPSVNAREAAVIDKLRIIPVDSLREAIDIIEERASARPLVSTKLAAAKEHSYADFADDRPAWGRKKSACASDGRYSARPYQERSNRSHKNLERGRSATQRINFGTTIPRPTPHRFGSGNRRRRDKSASGRD